MLLWWAAIDSSLFMDLFFALLVCARGIYVSICLLQMWTNPMQPPIQGCLPSLEDLACGNTTGLRPQAITKAQLDTARPLHQVKAYPPTEHTGHGTPVYGLHPSPHIPFEIARQE